MELSRMWCDPGGTQTHDLQNRNLTLYSTKLPNQRLRKSTYNILFKQILVKNIFKYDILRHPNVKLSRDGGAPAYVHGFGELEGNPWANGASEEVSDITEEVETMYAERQNREVIALDELEFAMHLEKIKKESEKENKE